MHVQNCVCIKFQIKYEIDGYTRLHKPQNDRYARKSTAAQAPIGRLYNCRFDVCTSVELTIVQVSN